MHDGLKPRRMTVLALPRILARLRAEGFRFVTVSKLLGLADSTKVPR
jgi:peptidoglycan/xylan/chitin deacetylase (PgdA/CDA1 family)